MVDFKRLEPLFRVHCDHIKQSWPTYERLTKEILENPELGLVIISEGPFDGSDRDLFPQTIVAGFLTLTFRYDFRWYTDDLMLQGAQTLSQSRSQQAEVLESIKEWLVDASFEGLRRRVSSIVFVCPS